MTSPDSYAAVMSRRDEIVRKSVGIDYAAYRCGSLAFDYERLLADTGYDVEAVAAQQRFDEIDGARGLRFCGAYWSYGFHEDGLQSARRVLERMGVDPRLPSRAEELRPELAGTSAP